MTQEPDLGLAMDELGHALDFLCDASAYEMPQMMESLLPSSLSTRTRGD